MSFFATPRGMSRRHFVSHLAGSAALLGPAAAMGASLKQGAETLRRNGKSCILIWMGGGPPTIDLWDLKPGAPTGGPSQPIATTGETQISDKLPRIAKHMDKLSIVRSMSTREADHTRGSYYMHTGYVPNPNIQHPSYGSVVAHELEPELGGLEIPPFVTIDTGGMGPGFLGMAYAPFRVNNRGQISNLKNSLDAWRMRGRVALLDSLESRFNRQRRGVAGEEHAKVLAKTRALMSSSQMAAFQVDKEPQSLKEKYGATGLGRRCLLARRLVESGVPFVEVGYGGWDLHQNCFTTLENRLPEMDQAVGALMEDLAERGLLKNTVVLCMGEFGRTPRINGDAGRDHYARAWSVVIGGGGLAGGLAVGSTNADGTRVETEPYSSEDLMATVCQAMGISLQTTFTSNNGRPMKIAGGGKIIRELFA